MPLLSERKRKGKKNSSMSPLDIQQHPDTCVQAYAGTHLRSMRTHSAQSTAVASDCAATATVAAVTTVGLVGESAAAAVAAAAEVVLAAAAIAAA